MSEAEKLSVSYLGASLGCPGVSLLSLASLGKVRRDSG